MKHLLLKLLLASLWVLLSATMYAQDNFEKYRRERKEEFARHKQAVSEDFKNYRDSVNTAFAKFLEESWKEFDLQRRELTFEPMPEPPVYVPVEPTPHPTPQPAPKPEPQPQPTPKPEPTPQPDQRPIPVPSKYPVRAEFFGGQIGLQPFDIPKRRLSGLSEKDIADYWVSLSQQPTGKLAYDIMRIKS